MDVNFDSDIRPFFQVLVKRVNEKVTTQIFFRELKRKLAERSGSGSKHQFKILQPTSIGEVDEDHFFAAHVRHKQVPTWFKPEGRVNFEDTTGNVIYDIENDLVVFYQKEEYVFVHTNCSQLFSIIQDTQESLSAGKTKFWKLSGQQMNQCLTQFQIEYRSLGIQNHFGLGGSAPDGKIYHGRDTSNSLTPSFDAGYGFSFCIGKMKQDDGTSLPFGCSKNKSKLWTTWIDDLDAFCDACDQVVQWLKSPYKPNAQLDVLIQSTSKDIIDLLNPVEFFLDYFAMEKGPVFLGIEGELSLDWICRYDPNSKSIIFICSTSKGPIATEIEFKFDKDNEAYDFSYKVGAQLFGIAIVPSEDRITARSTHDLVDFLNKQHHFTILYDRPYAYRDFECWEDNRLNKVFSEAEHSISWSGVNITKESEDASPDLNILQRLDAHFRADGDLLFGCIDDGSSEIADYLAVYENKVILVHAKFSSDVTPGLRIGDIQVVASQTVKNVRFFLPTGYSDLTISRLFKKGKIKRGMNSEKEFKEKLFKILQSKDTSKECWIVQPGISAKKLARFKGDKMHTILNFVKSILRVNNILFKFYCSK